MDKNRRAVALFSGGLDSVLSVVWMQNLGYTVYPVAFRTPYISAAKAEEYGRENGLQVIVRDITAPHLEMMRSPVHGFGKNFNPCIDCHALMFREAARLLPELGADFLISGEVLGQRPMSQRQGALQAVNKLSGVGDLIIRPLSQKLLPDTLPIRAGWVEADALLDIQGRGRTRQLELANSLGLRYPSPGGGCRLTDRNFSLRLGELLEYGEASAENISLLRWGRHFRFGPGLKLVVGRTQEDNAGLEEELFPGTYFKLRDHEGPLGLLTSLAPPQDILRLAASIVLYYSGKAASPDWVKYGVDKSYASQIKVEKCDREVLRGHLIALCKEHT